MLFLRFFIDIDSELARKTSLDFLASTRDEAGLTEDTEYDNHGQRIIEDETGLWSIIEGLCGYELQSETLAEAIAEVAEMTALPYGNIATQDWAIFYGEYVKRLVFCDGDAFRPDGVLHVHTA